MLPNFLIVGAEKAGTTTLAASLSEHPDIYMSPVKEVRFFSHNWDKGVVWYKSHFAEAKREKMRGEASPAYTRYPMIIDVPRRIYETLGDIKYVYIVRHPVERAISHYRHALYYEWFPPTVGFTEALETKPFLRDCSRYYYQIEQYLTYSAPSQWLVVTLEDLCDEPNLVYSEVFRFLDVDPTFTPSHQVLNATETRKVAPSWPKEVSQKLGPVAKILPVQAKRALRSSLTEIFSRPVKRPTLSSSLRQSLIREFRPDVERLSRFCGRDFIALWDLG